MPSDTLASATLPECEENSCDPATRKAPKDGARLGKKPRAQGCRGPLRGSKGREAQRPGAPPTGETPGSIAHEFNNLLTVILGHAEFLLDREETRERSRARVEEIRKAAERGKWLAGRLGAPVSDRIPDKDQAARDGKSRTGL